MYTCISNIKFSKYAILKLLSESDIYVCNGYQVLAAYICIYKVYHAAS